MDSIRWARNLVKGRIAETIFAQMYRDTNEFTVLDFGYEKVIPDLVEQGYAHDNPAIETLRVAPDFAVISQTSKEVRLVEVKYRHEIVPSEILNSAKKMHAAWNPSYLFVAALDGFYFDEVNEIIGNHGNIARLRHTQIPLELQEKYLKILQDFERNN